MSLDVTPEYAKSLGRIGGQLLSDNLLFQGQDIQFDTDLLYLDVVNKRIAINNFGASPFELFIGSAASDQKIESNNLIVDGVTTTNNGWTIQTNNIQLPATGTLYVRPVQTTDPIIYTNGMGDDKINIFDRLIVAKNANENINISPTSTLTNVTGNLRVQGTSGLTYITGSVLVDGNYLAGSQINFGDQTNDLLDFNSEINSDLVPKITDTWGISNNSEKWGFLNAYNLTGANVTNIIGTLGGISIRGNSIFSADIARDITIQTTAGAIQTLLDGGISLEPYVNIVDAGLASDALIDLSDGGLASSEYTNSDILLNGLPAFRESNINNNTFNLHNPPYYLVSSSDGFVRFSGTNGIVIPLGTSAQREIQITGTTRFNTDLGYLEVYNGTSWQGAIGSTPLATLQDIEDSSVIYDLMLG